MKAIHFVLTVAAAVLFAGQMNVVAQEVEPVSSNQKILIVYFSRTGNTREIAEQIHNKVGGDIFEVQSVQTAEDQVAQWL